MSFRCPDATLGHRSPSRSVSQNPGEFYPLAVPGPYATNSLAPQQRLEAVDGFPAERRDGVAVHVKRERHCAMSEHPLHDLGVRSRREGERGGRMPERVERNIRKLGAPEERLERAAVKVRASQGFSVRVGEHETLWLWSRPEPLAVAPQRLEGEGGNVHSPAAVRGLRFREAAPAVLRLDERAPHMHGTRVEVDVPLVQAPELAEPKPRRDRKDAEGDPCQAPGPFPR